MATPITTITKYEQLQQQVENCKATGLVTVYHWLDYCIAE